MIAIIHPDTLSALGLQSIFERIMPMAETHLFASFEEMEDAGRVEFFHYFVSSDVLLGHANFFLLRTRKTMVLTRGAEGRYVPGTFVQLDCRMPEEQLIHALVRLADRAHGKHHAHPMVAHGAEAGVPQQTPILTQREIEVLRLVTQGLINKEIADKLCVSLPTVVTHRKNITEKLGTRSVSALTVYALTHGIIDLEEI